MGEVEKWEGFDFCLVLLSKEFLQYEAKFHVIIPVIIQGLRKKNIELKKKLSQVATKALAVH